MNGCDIGKCCIVQDNLQWPDIDEAQGNKWHQQNCSYKGNIMIHVNIQGSSASHGIYRHTGAMWINIGTHNTLVWAALSVCDCLAYPQMASWGMHTQAQCNWK